MRNSKLTALMFILITYITIISAIAPALGEQHNLYPVLVVDKSNNEKWGYIDESGKMVIEPKYEHAYAFNNHVAIVISNDGPGYAYIDEYGKYILNPQPLWLDYFQEGLARVSSDGKTGYIDKTGKIVVDPKFDSADNFSEGLATVCIRYNSSGNHFGENYGYIDKTGKTVINPQFDNAGSFSNGLAKVKIKKSSDIASWGFIDRSGKFIINPQFDDVQDFSEELAAVNIDGKWGYINKSGKYAIKAVPYADVAPFSDGLAMVTMYGPKDQLLYGYIDRIGKTVIKPQFDDAVSFEDGFAVVGVGDDCCDSIFGSDNYNPNCTCRYGIIDKKGKFVTKPELEGIAEYSDGLHLVYLKNKYGFIDKQGKFVIYPKFDGASSFNKGLARFMQKSDQGYTYGYIDKKEKVIWSASVPDEGIAESFVFSNYYI